MVIGAIVALLLGIGYGLLDLQIPIISAITSHSDSVLYVLMFLVGISVGLNKGLLGRMKAYGWKIFVVPFGIVVGSMIGGGLCFFLCGATLGESVAIGSGLGWYSLTGVMITELSGARLGSIAFLSNLLREIFSFFSIPLLAKYTNYPTCIAPAGATSEDTTLPMMIRYTNEETVVLSVLNGIICSALVPVLIKFAYWFF